MIRKTSLEVYRQIEAEGLLARQMLETYKVVYECGPMTSGEAFAMLNKGNPIKALTQSRARFTDMRRMGVLSEVGERACRVTGRNAILWDVTDKLPVKVEKPKRTKCKACDGRGYFETQQTKFF